MALSRVKVWGTEVLTAADLNAEFDNILNNASSLISPLGGALDWDGYAHTLDAAGVTTAQSTATIGWSFTPGSKAGTPGTTGGISNWAASTWTDSNTAGSGTATNWVGHAFQRPTLAATNSSVTTTNAATVYIANSPLAGTNETLTNAYALWVDAGNVRFDGDIHSGALAYTFPAAAGALPTIASQAEVTAMTSTTTALTPNHNKIITSALANVSGTSTTIVTGLPAGVRRFTVTFVGFSTNGTNDWLFQIGPSGGVATSGYLGSAGNSSGGDVAGTTGVRILSNSGANVGHFRISCELHDSATNTWLCTVQGGLSNAAATIRGGYSVALSGALDRAVITSVGGTDTLDAGSYSYSYER